MPNDPLRLLGLYYLVGGLWPVVHLRSFFALTGPKREGWLVQTFGLFLAASGVSLLANADGGRRAQERMAVLGSVALAMCDMYFVARRRLGPIYLADAAVELLLAGAVVSRASGHPPALAARTTITSRLSNKPKTITPDM